ncbi:MAG: hypothetical protein ACKOXM_02460 [Agromyces sp.]
MADWRFWRKPDTRIDYGPDPEPPSLEEATAEGVAMAKQAAVMALKNRILVSAHTAPDEFDVAEFMEVARDIVEALAVESDEAAERTVRDREAAALLKGRGMHQHDYRRRDLDNLNLRIESFEAVAARLREVTADDNRMRELVIRARDQAWAELAREMERSLDRAALLEHGDDQYEAERDQRLREFLTVDLFRLQMKAQRERSTSNAGSSETDNDY